MESLPLEVRRLRGRLELRAAVERNGGQPGTRCEQVKGSLNSVEAPSEEGNGTARLRADAAQ